MPNLFCFFMMKSEDREVTGKSVEQISLKTAEVASLCMGG